MNVLYLSLQRLKAIGILVVLIFSSIVTWANDCGTATVMTTGSSYTLTIDATCNYSPSSQNVCGACTASGGDAWFRWTPGGTNALQQDVTFTVLPDFNGTISVSIIYSESIDGSGVVTTLQIVTTDFHFLARQMVEREIKFQTA